MESQSTVTTRILKKAYLRWLLQHLFVHLCHVIITSFPAAFPLVGLQSLVIKLSHCETVHHSRISDTVRILMAGREPVSGFNHGFLSRAVALGQTNSFYPNLSLTSTHAVNHLQSSWNVTIKSSLGKNVLTVALQITQPYSLSTHARTRTRTHTRAHTN